MGIAQRYEQARAEVRATCEQAGRLPQGVTLVAVSKTVGPDGVEQAIAAGAQDFGENRPEQLVQKAEAYPQARWHFIGNIQSRQIRKIVQHAHLIHSLYEDRHAAKIDAAAAELGKVQDVLLEVNVSGEQSKSGIAPDGLPALAQFCAGLPHVRVRGLMTMAPQGDLDTARRVFAGLRQLADELRFGMDDAQAQLFSELSMGMSEDWRIAIEEGATIVRIGRAIFSDDFA